MACVCLTCGQIVQDQTDRAAGRAGLMHFAEAARALNESPYMVRKLVERGTLRTRTYEGREYVVGDTVRSALNQGLGKSDEDARFEYFERHGGGGWAHAAEQQRRQEAAEAEERREMYAMGASIYPPDPAGSGPRTPADSGLDPLARFVARHAPEGGR